MSLRPPRRIFARKKRLSGASLGLRSCALLAIGLTTAFGAKLVAANWPTGQATSETDLPAISETPLLPAHDPVMRLAAAQPGAEPPGHDPARRTARNVP